MGDCLIGDGSPCASDGWANSKGENDVADMRLPGFWREDRLLSFFLGFLVLMTIVVPMLGLSRPGRIAIDLTFALMLFSGAIATVHGRMLMFLIVALTILEFTADLIVEFNPSFSPRGWDTALKVFCMAILVVMTLKHTFVLLTRRFRSKSTRMRLITPKGMGRNRE
jgi:hypothetical protein